MIMNKKGLEFAIGTIVLIIISILIFSMSMYFVFKWFSSAEELKAEIDRQTQNEILASLKTGNELVSIPINVKTIKRGDSVTFGVGVKNIGSSKNFRGTVVFSNAYAPDGSVLPVEKDYVSNYWLGNFNIISTFELKKNQEKLLPILIRAYPSVSQGMSTPVGTYVFNLCIYDSGLRFDGSVPAECSSEQYKRGSEFFYTSKIYQFVIVVK